MKAAEMPDFQIPPLQSEIEQFGVCAVIHDPDPQLIAHTREHRTGESVAEFEESGSGEKRWLEWTSEVWEGNTVHFHLHLELSRVKPENTNAESCTYDQILSFCDEDLAIADGCAAEVRSRAVTRIPVSDLAQDVRTLINAAPGHPLSLSSVNIDIIDDVFYSLMIQTLEEPSRVRASLFGGIDMPLDPEFCNHMAQLMKFGLDRFVLGRT